MHRGLWGKITIRKLYITDIRVTFDSKHISIVEEETI